MFDFSFQVRTEIAERKEREENKERLGRMNSDKEEFLQRLKQERHQVHLVRQTLSSCHLLPCSSPHPCPGFPHLLFRRK